MSQKDLGIVQKFFYDRPGLLALAKRMSGKDDNQFILEREIKAQGWKVYISKLASMYIERALRGEYPLNGDVKLTGEIQAFEDHLSSFFIAGHGRAFLLGFYYKMWSIEAARSHISMNGNALTNLDETLVLIKKVRSRVLQIDYLFITLQHLISFIGSDKLGFLLDQGHDLIEIYTHLELNQRKNLVDSLLSYSSSINEVDFLSPLNV
ncbi:hypothetical protein [Bacteriovorax sp. BSW11_IV]|uniref:hypothetical protein n=1 Tax=Bacteriovorax sp. BSW11_IV TaxID=1353529 RepID=UPI000426351C|nr:hypothetical protein [Bacteriovorax sp. BSW11_IV]